MTNGVSAMSLGTWANPDKARKHHIIFHKKLSTFSCHHEISVLHFVQFGNP